MWFWKKRDQVKTRKNEINIKSNSDISHTPNEDVQFVVKEGLLHCCCSLSPEAFKQMMGNSRLPFATWYQGLWLVQHNEKIHVAELANELGISWIIAKNMKHQILTLLSDIHIRPTEK